MRLLGAGGAKLDKHTVTKVERFRVQRSGLKNSQPTPIKKVRTEEQVIPEKSRI